MCRKTALANLLAFFVILGAGCGGGGNDEPTVDLTGTWTLSASNFKSDCGFPIDDPVGTLPIIITQTGGKVVITGAGGEQLNFTGTVKGNTLAFDGTQGGNLDNYPACTITLSWDAEGTASETLVNGTASVKVKLADSGCEPLNGFECTITFQFKMAKVS